MRDVNLNGEWKNIAVSCWAGGDTEDVCRDLLSGAELGLRERWDIQAAFSAAASGALSIRAPSEVAFSGYPVPRSARAAYCRSVGIAEKGMMHQNLDEKSGCEQLLLERPGNAGGVWLGK